MKFYAAIDLKSFYASVECVERGLDPMTTNLVVADAARTNKTICLAISPALKAFGVPGRPRLFEVEQQVGSINALRQQRAPGRRFTGSSVRLPELQQNPALSLDYIVAPPRMAYYMKYSTQIYGVYLKYMAPEDIHVYSIDEVFLDVTPYLKVSGLTPRQFIQRMILDVFRTTGITATAGIGTNLYLCKIAMDILAKRTEPDENGVRIAELDELSYRKQLWSHRPLTDFWRVGHGYARKLEAHGLFTMGDVARCSLTNENLLYKLFGINAELLIDHAWGWEQCTLAQVKAYRPATNSISSGQVLHCPYSFEKARLIVQEMTDALALDLLDRGLVTDQLTLTVGYDRDGAAHGYTGSVVTDHYGRRIPKHAHGTANLPQKTASTMQIMEAVLRLYDRITDSALPVRRITLCANRITPENKTDTACYQMDLFADPQRDAALERERRRREAELYIKKKYGKNAILKGASYRDGATARDRNHQIGGHRA